MKLSVITVSYNAEDFIRDYLNSLKEHLSADSEVIIVDNNSQDDTVKIIKEFEFVRLIQNNSNLGFSKGNNIGAKKATGEFLLFLNHDAKVENNGIEILLEYLEKNPDVGMVGPKLAEGDKIQRSVSKFPTLLGAAKEYLLNQKNSYTQFAPKADQPIEVEVIYGAAIMVRAELFRKIEGFDERYFLFYEDIELCKKIHNLGLKIVYLPAAKFSHLVGASMKNAEKMPFGIRTLSWFWPIKKSGSRYYMIQSARIYHGILIATMIRILMYIGTKVRKGFLTSETVL